MLPFRPVTSIRILLWPVLLLIAGWCLHLTLGYRLVDAVYHAPESSLADFLMPGRAATPLESYYRQADFVAIRLTVLIAAALTASALLLYNFRGALLLAFSCFASSFALFLLVETFPGLISLFRLDSVLGYYAYKTNYLADAELGYRERPFNRRLIRDFTGTGFSSRYRVEVQPYTIEWIMDRDGFRNRPDGRSADVVVLGDSYVEYGSTADDTWVGRMERKLSPLRVRNLGKSGYTVAQYVEAMKRFGLRDQPRIAVLAIYEGNDLTEMRDFLLWQRGRLSEVSSSLLKFGAASLVRRYMAAAGASAGEMKKRAQALRDLLLDTLALRRDSALPIHPDIAIVKLGSRSERKLFIDKLPAASPAELLSRDEFGAIGGLLKEFREICRSHGIAPLIVYIPTAAHVYAEYSTPESGSQWLRIRERQIVARKNLEQAFETAVAAAGLPFVSLAPVFERAAAHGRMLYYPLDAHWNEEGREIAAEHLAALIRRRFSAVFEEPRGAPRAA